MSIDYLIKTETAHDGTFTGMAFTRDNGAMRITVRDVAGGFPTRYAAAKWAKKCRSAQMAINEALQPVDTPRAIISRALTERRDDFNAMLRARIASDRAYLETLAPANSARQGVRASIWAAEKAQCWADCGDLDALVSECGPMIIALGIACKVLGIPAHVRTQAAIRWDAGER